MNQQVADLMARIRVLQEEIETLYHQARKELDRQRSELADEFLRRQRRYKVGLLRFIAQAPALVVLTAPIIYAGWIPFLLMDLFVTVYQVSCFPVYGIPRVHRAGYLVFDRGGLPYLNLIERFNCFYCAYANGVAAYTREVAGRTEQYWCPIKHARRLNGAHDCYPKFLDHGDAEATAKSWSGCAGITMSCAPRAARTDAPRWPACRTLIGGRGRSGPGRMSGLAIGCHGCVAQGFQGLPGA